MSLSKEQMDAKIIEHFAFEAADDVAGVLATLSPDATHDVVGWPAGPSHGRDQARSFYETLFSDLADGSVTCTRRLYGDDFLVDESVWKGKAVGHPFGLVGDNRPLEFRLLHVMEFSADGRIDREQVWVDLAAITRQLTQG
jgi:predicted ester cyclase